MRFALVGALGLGLVGCGDDDTTPVDGGQDSGVDAGASDGGSETDAGEDAAAADAGDDAGPTDAGTDAGFDSGLMSCAIATIPFTGPIPAMTIDETDDFDPPDDDSCPFALATGPDRVYALVAGQGAGTYEVTADPTMDEFDLMLYVLDACDATTCLAGTRLNGPGVAESVQLEMTADQIVYVVIDTMAESGPGAFVLSARKL
ncbi:MAG: hypothetical protein H6724_07090 [Sandaracinus sp.]|nr:hypothetical protein [Myxococcales bacterium]MCB9599204.1 hypothetical protein [Sandaracinus sp.]MCB9619202.1 hypothetical protein [Sandaracinus sp.]